MFKKQNITKKYIPALQIITMDISSSWHRDFDIWSSFHFIISRMWIPDKGILQFWVESPGAMLEFWYIEIGRLFQDIFPVIKFKVHCLDVFNAVTSVQCCQICYRACEKTESLSHWNIPLLLSISCSYFWVFINRGVQQAKERMGLINRTSPYYMGKEHNFLAGHPCG